MKYLNSLILIIFILVVFIPAPVVLKGHVVPFENKAYVKVINKTQSKIDALLVRQNSDSDIVTIKSNTNTAIFNANEFNISVRLLNKTIALEKSYKCPYRINFFTLTVDNDKTILNENKLRNMLTEYADIINNIKFIFLLFITLWFLKSVIPATILKPEDKKKFALKTLGASLLLIIVLTTLFAGIVFLLNSVLQIPEISGIVYFIAYVIAFTIIDYFILTKIYAPQFDKKRVVITVISANVLMFIIYMNSAGWFFSVMSIVFGKIG